MLRGKRFVFVALGLFIAVLCVYPVSRFAMMRRIRSELKARFGDDYAIVRIHSGGEPMMRPSLRRILWLAYHYKYSGEYEPMGTGRFTGKQNYLLFLVSDNEHLHTLHWSFREFRLNGDEALVWWDDIRNQRDSLHAYYGFDPDERIRIDGIWCHPQLNSEKTTFYYWSRARRRNSGTRGD